MKKSLMVATLLTVLSISTSVAQAAEEITKEQAKQYQEVGTVSSTKEHTAPADAKQEISEKADAMGGKYYVITSAREGDKVSGTATVYK